jgi:hypothetical protein
MKDVAKDVGLIAACGLYCGACRSYRKGRCPGCRENAKATWCAVRSCCTENNWASCAECTNYVLPNDCRKFNNVISKVMALAFNSNRQACILKIRELGRADFAAHMADRGTETLPRRSS